MIELIFILFSCCIAVFLFKDNYQQILITKPIFQQFQIRPSKYFALSFGGGSLNYTDATRRLSSELYKTNLFYHIYSFTEADLMKDPEFWDKHKLFIHKYEKAGYGYWIWKSYLIMKTLEDLDDNDILLYLDSGCEIADFTDAPERLKLLLEKCEIHDFLYNPSRHLEKHYTKMDLFDYMGLNYTDITDTTQIGAGILFIKKTQKNLNLTREWYSIMSENYNLIDSSRGKLQNDPAFRDNRHDQSVLSLLVKSKKYADYYGTGHMLIDPYPILISRKRHG